jgi:phosphatidylethanolamine/phosphatidyl-N-methylethanolamine N-methyltransferase
VVCLLRRLFADAHFRGNANSGRLRQPIGADNCEGPLMPRPDYSIAFLRGFLERPKEVGSIIPSSRWMRRRITQTAEIDKAKLAIELGPGTGGTTKALLQAMAPDATIIAIEFKADFCALLCASIDDPRLIIHQGSAADIEEALTKRNLAAADVVLSGIPLSTMPREVGLSILRAARTSREWGR